MLGLREQFPILANNPGLAYLDSAATAQKPVAVLDAVNDYLTNQNANAGRGSYPWANATTRLVDDTKTRVCRFLDDRSSESSVHFAGGTSDGLHRVADFVLPHLENGAEIIAPLQDHQANALPWLNLVEEAAARGIAVTLRSMPYDASGDYDLDALQTIVSSRTALISATHVHHVFGAEMQIAKLREVIGPRIPLCLDAAQSVGHMPVDVAELDVDFVVFSGHKAMALPGVGVIWARNSRVPPFTVRGWEGTPNITGIVSLYAAMEWLDATGLDKIQSKLAAMTDYLADGLVAIDGVRLVGCPHVRSAGNEGLPRRSSLVTFQYDRIDSGDLGFVLAAEGIMVRANNHCQAGTSEAEASVRVSLHIYNKPEEIERLLRVIRSI